jgi:hypothetical protein
MDGQRRSVTGCRFKREREARRERSESVFSDHLMEFLGRAVRRWRAGARLDGEGGRWRRAGEIHYFFGACGHDSYERDVRRCPQTGAEGMFRGRGRNNGLDRTGRTAASAGRFLGGPDAAINGGKSGSDDMPRERQGDVA